MRDLVLFGMPFGFHTVCKLAKGDSEFTMVSRVSIGCILFLAFLIQDVASHGLHLSIGKVEVGETEVVGKLTFNKLDFVEALDQWDSATPIYELTPEAFEKLTLRYMKRHFKVEANGATDLRLEITKAGQGEETLWMGFRFASSDTLKQIKVEHRALFGIFPDQANVLEVKAGGRKQTHMFRVDSPTAIFKLDK